MRACVQGFLTSALVVSSFAVVDLEARGGGAPERVLQVWSALRPACFWFISVLGRNKTQLAESVMVCHESQAACTSRFSMARATGLAACSTFPWTALPGAHQPRPVPLACICNATDLLPSMLGTDASHAWLRCRHALDAPDLAWAQQQVTEQGETTVLIQAEARLYNRLDSSA